MSTDFEAKVKAVIDRLHPHEHKQMEQEVGTLLEEHGVGSEDDLIALARDKDCHPSARETTCWLLARLDCGQSVHALLDVLNDENPVLRRASAHALGEINVPRWQAVEPLIERLQDQDTEVRKAAAYGLGLIRDKRATNALVSTLEDRQESSDVRGEAAEALSNVGDEDAVAPLINALRDPSPELRFWAAFALGQLAASEALPELERLVEEDHEEVPGWHSVSQEAADAIKAIRGSSDLNDS